MIWLLAHRGMKTRQKAYPYTETPIAGANSLVYSAGVAPVRISGLTKAGTAGTWARGLHRASGFVFSFDGSAAETLLGIDEAIDLTVQYLAGGNEHRRRRLLDVVFVGDATVRVPVLNEGVGDLVGVPFKVNIPAGETLAEHIVDEAD